MASIDSAARLRLGRIERALGPAPYAAIFSTRQRLGIRFLDVPEPPEGWLLVPIHRPPGRYPYLVFAGKDARNFLMRSRLSVPSRAVLTISLDTRQAVLRRVR